MLVYNVRYKIRLLDNNQIGVFAMHLSNGSITSVKGFSASGVSCGLKKNGDPDLALLVSDVPAAAAGVFTQNVVKGHSLQRTISRIKGGLVKAVVINSGNANACVGDEGLADAEQMAASAARLLGCSADEVMTGSTGVIGKRLDMAAIESGIGQAFESLGTDAEAGHRAELAIMTTDLVPKEAVVRFDYEGKTVTVAGMAKGSGMIHPNMATMIGLIATDLAVDPGLLRELLKEVSDRTFNRVSVDGDTSVCDMVLALANGMSGLRAAAQSDSMLTGLFVQALEAVCVELAKKIAGDGEGATKLIEIRCLGAHSAEDAYKIVMAVGKSPLVKTAIFGEDANWGRILTAAGYSGASFNPDLCDILLGDLMVCEKGKALLFDEDLAKSILQQKEVAITIKLGDGDAADHLWTCDFSYDYVRINGSYRT
jgi:glutamate N-acetyltransferase/amino-acid N-acetyltransferase